MCGLIAASFSDARVDATQQIQRALDHMVRRGPDAEGLWHEGGVWMGHRRLAILDLDVRASQPLHSSCGRYVIVFNGEIYNFRDLRRRLEAAGVSFRTESDTEVLLELFKAEGEAMLGKLRGMFSLAIWDRSTHRLFAARDPYGIKPLYVATVKGGLLLGSQVKALLATGLVSRAPSVAGQAGFWMLGSVPEPHTWYADVRALPAGSCLWAQNGQLISQRRWHDIADAWRQACEAPARPASEVAAVVRDALRESVGRHLVADVPVGVFLSGGIDSSALAGLMVDAGARNIQGITIAFDEFSGQHRDEAPVAREVADFYGVTHHVRRVTRQEFLQDMPRILAAMDQPSIDGVNTWYASKAVAELGLKVVVSGVGGDELFLGYESFQTTPRLLRRWRSVSAVPGVHAFGQALGAINARRTGNGRWKHAADWARTTAGAWWLKRSLAAPQELRYFMAAGSAEQLEPFVVDQWMSEMAGELPSNDVMALAQLESSCYLRNQLLRDSDWASMDHSVELRTPLVDSTLLSALSPVLRNFEAFPQKKLLAQAPSRPVPDAVADRRKTGFGIPLIQWLDGYEGHADGPGLAGWAPWARRIAATQADTSPMKGST